ncbi:MAG TPA: methyltransferase domain-containing protein [Pilimelia sp.]|nr:methyltransferase domain-containing protein [Pilimelia sp.]
MESQKFDLHTPYRGHPADVIPLQYHAHMLLDEHRMSSFREAINLVVRPGMHVLDLGTGTGVLSFFAVQCGARVTAVEREPGVLRAARRALADVGDRVTLVHADARDYLPEDPVDVVVCEMMHVGQLRERQIEVIDSFKRRYLPRFGPRLPRFIPEACVQAVQPVEQDFSFYGFRVAAPMFQDPFASQPRTIELAAPQVFQRFFYRDELPTVCSGDLTFTTTQPGRFNAVRLITKNLLAVETVPPRSVDWLMNYLVAPLPQPMTVKRDTRFRIFFEYAPGEEIPSLIDSLRATPAPQYAGA